LRRLGDVENTFFMGKLGITERNYERKNIKKENSKKYKNLERLSGVLLLRLL